MYKDVSIRQPTQDSTNLKLLEDVHEERRYWFARHCHKNGSTLAPSGFSWEEAFKRKEGVTLKEYVKFAKENKLGERYAIQDKSRRDNLQTKVRI
jgi:hypothetical protein